MTTTHRKSGVHLQTAASFTNIRSRWPHLSWSSHRYLITNNNPNQLALSHSHWPWLHLLVAHRANKTATVEDGLLSLCSAALILINTVVIKRKAIKCPWFKLWHTTQLPFNSNLLMTKAAHIRSDWDMTFGFTAESEAFCRGFHVSVTRHMLYFPMLHVTQWQR